MASKLQTIKITKVPWFSYTGSTTLYVDRLMFGDFLYARRHETTEYSRHKAEFRFKPSVKFSGICYAWFADFNDNPGLVLHLKSLEVSGIQSFDKGGIEIPDNYAEVAKANELMNPPTKYREESSETLTSQSTIRKENIVNKDVKIETPEQIKGRRIRENISNRKQNTRFSLREQAEDADERREVLAMFREEAKDSQKRAMRQRAATKHIEVIDYLEDVKRVTKQIQTETESVVLTLRRALIRAESMNKSLTKQRDNLALKLRESKDREKTQRAKAVRLQERVDNLTDPDEKTTSLNGRNLPVFTGVGRTVDGREVVDVG